MDILATIKREEVKLEKQLSKLQHQLDGIRGTAKALGHAAEREVVGVPILLQLDILHDHASMTCRAPLPVTRRWPSATSWVP